jgi:toxin ParE1/3/4
MKRMRPRLQPLTEASRRRRKAALFPPKKFARVWNSGSQNHLHTEDSLADLEAILDYIREDNPVAARKFGTSLLNHVDLLAAFPHLGMSVNKRSGVRKLLLSPIRIYYQIREEIGVIEILHFRHAARRPPKF